MKRIICMLLSLLMLALCFVACEDTSNSPPSSNVNTDTNTDTQAPAHVHTYQPATCAAPQTCSGCGETIGVKKDHDVDSGKCSMCGLSYYDEYVSLVKANTSTSGSSAFVHVVTYGDYEIWLRYEEGGETYIACFESSKTVLEGMVLFVDKASVKKQEYAWEMRAGTFTSNGGEISGKLDATDFSQNTAALEYTNNTFTSNATASKEAKNAAKLLDIALVHGLKPLLEKSDKDISIAHFGFEHYE